MRSSLAWSFSFSEYLVELLLSFEYRTAGNGLGSTALVVGTQSRNAALVSEVL